jgi:sucrose-phosphate synthase
MENFLIAGSSGNDEEMLKGDTYGVVVSNYSAELEKLRGRPRIYFAENSHAKGIMEGIKHFSFLDNVIRGETETHASD